MLTFWWFRGATCLWRPMVRFALYLGRKFLTILYNIVTMYTKLTCIILPHPWNAQSCPSHMKSTLLLPLRFILYRLQYASPVYSFLPFRFSAPKGTCVWVTEVIVYGTQLYTAAPAESSRYQKWFYIGWGVQTFTANIIFRRTFKSWTIRNNLYVKFLSTMFASILSKCVQGLFLYIPLRFDR